ncbi:hypothetical protein ACFXAW_02900 [Streptomyces sp. NPDC059445]|uniref:hypothetical protein n=1 Tax=Streptomyces sp. NPDC059445 TaxID=3346832 RepID=UPI0036A335CD
MSARLLEADPLAVAMAAGAIYGLHASRGADARNFVAGPARVFFLLVQNARACGGDARMLLAGVERMPEADRAELLDDALELWAFYGRQHPDLVRGQDIGWASLSDTVEAVPGTDQGGVLPSAAGRRPLETDPAEQAGARHERNSTGHRAAAASGSRPLPVHRSSVTHHPSKESRIPMSETTDDVAQNAENAARSLAELVSDLQYGGTEHQVPAHRIYALFTRCAEQMKTALTLLRTSVESLQDQGLLMSDYRGEPLEDVLQRYTEFSARAERLAGELGADSVIERKAHNEASSEQEPTPDRFIAKLVADLRHQGIDYPLEAYRILSFLTRCAGEMRTALAVLKAPVEDREGDEVQRYAASLLIAEQLAGVLGKVYSAAGYLAYKEPTERGRA